MNLTDDKVVIRKDGERLLELTHEQYDMLTANEILERIETNAIDLGVTE